MTTALTYLYVPGDVPSRFDKALASGADAVVLDLEDAVAVANKDYARATVAEWIAGCDPGGVEIWVRVNPGSLDDIRAVAHPHVTGIWLPKVESATDVEVVDALLRSIAPHAAVSALIETAGGLFEALAIARAPRMKFLQIGEVDLAAELGIEVGDGSSLLVARSHIVAASIAAGISPPPAAVSRNFRDEAAFEADTATLAGLGFIGRACIHPAQLAPTRRIFTPTAEAVMEAEAVLSTLDSAASGVATDARGFLIDEAVAKRARRIVERARS
ncbi:CoA ester lyase [Rhodococcus sp. PAMC28707]|uniref:HpcH/HpaI aldolase/citrate lyase family protein n=1 Tax=unclassified Rhodococcus (in: high G+C Gram-positive bacteria) TaxID=192944 RepID=UPI00109E170B|nr:MULTISPECIES: CoA ester lyase [unclassified Rhodococcus (in: high G+C Gram-positive bacteria)]QCB51899.1 CoA ester lyase [Rhodococcus sp. PAMC28705]QCB59931.1 CoA ester lyase [Rhodococcus sp. PAMC28707]